MFNRATNVIFLSSALLAVSTSFGANLTLGSANDGNCYPFNCNDSGSNSGTSITYQQVFAASQFGSSAISISQVGFTDSFLQSFGLGQAAWLTGSYQISFAITNKAVNGLSTTLASNITSGLTSFGTYAGTGANFGGANFAGAFNYNPLLGNLLMIVTVTNQANVSSTTLGGLGWDADDTGAVTSRAYQIGSAAAQADATGLVSTFTYSSAAIPEPATCALIGGGLAALLGWKRRKSLKNKGGAALAVIVAVVVSASATAQTQTITPRTLGIPLHTVDGTPVSTSNAIVSALNIPTFNRTYNINSVNYPQIFVGTDPANTNITTTITVPVIPVIVVLSDGTIFDPTQRLHTAPPGSALSATLSTLTSPIFQNATYVTGGTTVGTGVQFGDAIQRATFWDSISTTSPNWHIRLQFQLKPSVTLTVPANIPNSASGPFADVDLNWFGGQLDAIAGNYGGSTTFPLFLTYEVLLTQNSGVSCCVLGYHTAIQTGASIQTYGYASYFDPFQITPSSDVSVVSHEVSEWLNDPFVNNIVPNWPAPFSFIAPGPPYSNICQNNLETGDPIQDRVDPAKVNLNITTFGRQYTLQNEALAPWFLHVTPSFSVNGYYTYKGAIDVEFAAPAPACTPTLGAEVQ